MRKILIKVSVVAILIIIILIFNNYRVNQKEINFGSKREVYLNEQKIDGLIFREMSYTFIPNTGSEVILKIINSNNELYTLKGLQIVILDNDNNVITTLDTNIYTELDYQEEFQYVLKMEENLVNANHKLQYVLNGGITHDK